jgi:glycosyltransferase involved in cell wall biosynthesis
VTSRQRELYQRLRSRAGLLRARLTGRPQPSQGAAEVAVRPRPGHPPEVAREVTHLGPVMDEAVVRAKRRMRIGADPDYDLVYENFDVLHYLLQSPRLLDRPDLDLIEHFLRHGLAARLSPHPDFSMAEYVSRYPHTATSAHERSPYLDWLRRGRAAGELADPAPGIEPMAHVLGLEPQQVLDLAAERRRDLQQRLRTGRLGEMVARATEIEPLIGAAWTEIARPRLLPLSRPAVVDEISVLYLAQEAADFRRARLVLVVNRARWGGGRRMEGHLAHALAGHVDPGDIVVIYTDDSTEAPADRYPHGVRAIDFARIAQDLPKEDTEHALVMLLRSFRADAIVNVNSKTLYYAMQTYGRALAVTERLFPVLFCNEQSAMGNWDGWGLRFFYRTFDDVTGVITDSEYFARELAAHSQLTAEQRERLHVLRAPVDPDLPVVAGPSADPGRRPQVFWAGRWDRQKRIGLFLQVARLMPEVDFQMWGEPLMGTRGEEIPENVSVRGRYTHISEVPLSEADVWLYTSAWDGAPSQLLEVAMTGIPVVGTLVGGTGEVLSADDAWPVPDGETADAYAAAIQAVLADPSEARRRALALRERMLRERTEKEFARQAAELLLREHATEEPGR